MKNIPTKRIRIDTDYEGTYYITDHDRGAAVEVPVDKLRRWEATRIAYWQMVSELGDLYENYWEEKEGEK